MAAFSATFKLLKTKFLILATHCTNKSKSAEPRAEQQACLIAMPRRESSSAQAKEHCNMTVMYDCVAKLQKYRMSCICHVTHGTRWDEMGRKSDDMGRESDEMGRKWDVNGTRWDENGTRK